MPRPLINQAWQAKIQTHNTESKAPESSQRRNSLSLAKRKIARILLRRKLGLAVLLAVWFWFSWTRFSL
jgi:hypothetical protein